eukprot:TRINITY_DN2317_c0_g1_i1.p1 TRINITY_DN2317_c0_g1~~TRINITY_DN2317_c0_g1_i1.p1  ORF type:complete len:258 (+),score=69.60 TRINITY_DN2317_c0_g1_i1:846-1619(+)
MHRNRSRATRKKSPHSRRSSRQKQAMRSNFINESLLNRIIDLENKLKEGEMKNQELQKEIKALEQIQKNQEKELDKIMGNSEANNKIKALNEQLKKTKEKNKELEKKIQAESTSYQKQHNYLLDLQEKYQKLKKDKIIWKKAIVEKKLPPAEGEEENDKRSEEEVIKTSIASLQKRLEVERSTSKKTLEGLKTEISEYQRKIKEAEQEFKLNTAKLTELKKLMRHNQLKPLEDKGEENASEAPEAGGKEKKGSVNNG